MYRNIVSLSIRDAVTIFSNLRLRRMVQKARAAGLETLIDYQRLALLIAAVRCTKQLEGDAIEFGSYRGGSAALIAQELEGTSKTLHVCDSFVGMPAVSTHDNYHKAGDFNDTSEIRVRKGLEMLGVRAQVHSGFFSNMLPSLAHLRFAIAHIDVDLYESVQDCIRFCYPRMLPGGIIILDDYGAPTCLGAKLAADEFFWGKPEVIVQLSNPSYGVWVGRSESNLFEMLRRHAGWLASLPMIGTTIFHRQSIKSMGGCH